MGRRRSSTSESEPWKGMDMFHLLLLPRFHSSMLTRLNEIRDEMVKDQAVHISGLTVSFSSPSITCFCCQGHAKKWRQLMEEGRKSFKDAATEAAAVREFLLTRPSYK